MKWVAKRVADKLRFHPNLNHVEAHEHLREHYGVHIDERKMFRAIKEVRSLVEGSIQLQYAKLWDYSHELTRSNEGSTVKMNCILIPRSFPQFHQIYICLDACKKGFKASCRPFIGLDGCFLKGYYGGHLLPVVGQDANNAFFVIAYVVVNVEDKDNWKWFLTLLHEDIGDYMQYGWNFMSNIQKVQFNIESLFHACMCNSFVSC